MILFFSAAIVRASSGVLTYGYRNARAADHPARGARRIRRQEAADRGLGSRSGGTRVQEGDERGRGRAERSTEADPLRQAGRGVRRGPQERRSEQPDQERPERVTCSRGASPKS